MPTTTVDYKRELHELYRADREPQIIDVPDLAFVMIDGHGDPNTAAQFGAAVEALYAVAYTAKFAVRRLPEGIDFRVMPLEGLFWAADLSTFTSEEKSSWDWTLMIMQPDRVTPEIFGEAQVAATKRKSSDAIARVRFERFAEGPAAQVLHIGPYSAEASTIERLHAFIAEHGYARAGKHHEIYLSDPRRAAPEKLRTIARQPIASDASPV